ncbi:non-hydrolyzing UDP-N-acetylglucosamine 2-epimerase [Alistipes sp. ZOR0009]|uniref:non-hydrolyzing UDP-N-acetylglucosamine 2-epimerase n=1 Tax=Alistipes sp. ZOR0009 TaxID=1339253 RepID=UPI0006490848|nr:UDP-N-acetylglucosamine 2-epimerase (non-hydrolyzing) [Alistipes sp. ZOR0009]
MKKVMLVFGTRPEAIKMAPLIKELQKSSELKTIVCVTGQHREMLDQVLNLFEIKPDYDLNIMKQGQDLYDVTSLVLTGMRDVLNDAKPNLVLVHGDTSSSTAAALAAFYQQIPVGHIEAGLRTHNIYSPWPEEVNRQITSRIATFHFAPTEKSKQNLINEGIDPSKISVTGNTVIDALIYVLDKINRNSSLEKNIELQLIKSGINESKFTKWINGNRKMVLITGHRRENFGTGFLSICEAIKKLAEIFPKVDFVYPMHLNPNVRKPIAEIFGEKQHEYSNIFFIDPLEYLPFVYLMNLSYLILTDSGGIQEEAPGLGKPVLVMRDTTERPEALEAGVVKLVGSCTNSIIKETSELLNYKELYTSMSGKKNPFGNGDASTIIVQTIINKHFNN